MLTKGDQLNDETIENVLSGFDAEARDQLDFISCVEGYHIDIFVNMIAALVKEKYLYAGCLQ